MPNARVAAEALRTAAERLRQQASHLMMAASALEEQGGRAHVQAARQIVESTLATGLPEMREDMIVGVSIEEAVLALMAAERDFIPVAMEGQAA